VGWTIIGISFIIWLALVLLLPRASTTTSPRLGHRPNVHDWPIPILGGHLGR
jgi:hypothetical protein